METIQPSKQVASFPISTQNGIGFLEFLDWRLNYSQGGSFATWPATGLSCLHINQVSDYKRNGQKYPHIQIAEPSTVSSEVFVYCHFLLCEWKRFPDDIALLQAVCSWPRNHRTRHVVKSPMQRAALGSFGFLLTPKIITNLFWPPLCDNLVNKQSQIIFWCFLHINSNAIDDISVTSAKAWVVILEFSDS